MLARNKKIWLLGAVALVAVGLAYAHAAEVAKDDSAGKYKAMAVAAQQTYDRMFLQLSKGQAGNVDEIYLWSRRALDAESRANPRALLDAAQAHEKRMEELSEVANAAAKILNGAPGFKATATEYYRWEAKALVADASRAK